MDEENELDFLRFFYAKVENAMGPGSDDVYYALKREYEALGNELPEGYKIDEES
jgi:hypothetical protein